MIQAEIQQMLAGTGAHGFRIASEHGKSAVSFTSGDRQFRLIVPHTASEDKEAARQSWRQLSQLIQAKLDAVASGLVVFDEEFLAYMVMPGGATVFQATAPAITTAYSKEIVDE
jgi:hypothetical protein